MSFNENDINRDKSGKFDHKVGSAADVNLDTEAGAQGVTAEQRAAFAEALGVDESAIVSSDEMHYDHLPTLSAGDEEYAFGTEEQANEAAKTYIGESLWAMNSSYLAQETGLSRDVFSALINESGGGEKYQEDYERIVANLADGGVDGFAERAIEEDGRGHYLSTYDGEETEVEVGDETFYLYRTN